MAKPHTFSHKVSAFIFIYIYIYIDLEYMSRSASCHNSIANTK